MIKKTYQLLLLVFIIFVLPVLSYASQNNSKTEDQQILTIEVVDDEQAQAGETSRFPITGETATAALTFGFFLVGIVIVFYFVRKKER